MASNSLGEIFRITTWGESHGKAIGVLIDGCPAGLQLHENDVKVALAKRAPGYSKYTSPRKETDFAEIYSGVFQGKTTGAPISIIIPNVDAEPKKYEPIKDIMRPGHANYTYIKKYGVFDYHGGGRASARETASRVAAGAVADKLLEQSGIKVRAFMHSIGTVTSMEPDLGYVSPIFAGDQVSEQKMLLELEQAIAAGDSLGGVVEFKITEVPVGLGDPMYHKLEAKLAQAMLSLPATKGFELGRGFAAANMSGFEHNDQFSASGQIMSSNNAGGLLGGISSGMPIFGRVAFKPTSSIKKKQNSIDINGNRADFILPSGSRHDPCVAIRAVPVVEAMCKLVLADAILLNRCVR